MKSILESIVRVAIVSIVFMGFMYLLKIGINYVNTFDMDKKIEAFQKEKTFFCTTGIINNQKMLVSKKNNWEVYKNEYFKREDMLLEIRLCKVQE